MPPPPPPGHFLGFAMLLSWRSIPHPRAPDQTHISFLLHIFHVQKPNDTFSQLLIWTFSWVYWEKDNGFKTWTINLKLKMKMKNSLKNASLIEHFMRTLDWISVSLYISLYSFSYKKLSLLKAELKKYFCPSFPENKLLTSTHHAHIHFKF